MISEQEFNWDDFAKSIDEIQPVINVSICNNAITKINLPHRITQTNFPFKPAHVQTSKPFIKQQVCDACGGEIKVFSEYKACVKCGKECIELLQMPESTSTTDVTLKIVGKGVSKHQRQMYASSADAYPAIRKYKTLKELQQWNNNSDIKLPKSVLYEANELFNEIKAKGYVFRKDNKDGVLSSCLFYKCAENNINRTPNEIAKFSNNIRECFQSFGDRILQDLNERGIIKIDTSINPIRSYVERYLEIMKIPDVSNTGVQYKQFVLDIINYVEKAKIYIMHDFQEHTKAVGSIYILIRRIPELRDRISKEDIEDICHISKTTFDNYMNVIFRYWKCIKKAFKKNKVPMPAQWRI